MRPRAAAALALLLAACGDPARATGAPDDGAPSNTLGAGDNIRDFAPPPGMVRSAGYGINNQGTVAGYGTTATGASQAYLWSATGVPTTLAVPTGWGSSFALFVNDSMVAGGAALTPAGSFHAVRWKGGVMTDLGVLPGGSMSVALGVNPAGDIVGWSEVLVNGKVTARGFRWTQAGGMRDLGTLPGGVMSHAAEINAGGTVVGTSFDATGDARAFTWTQSGGIVALAEPTGTRESSAVGSSAQGDACGFITLADNTTRAVAWPRTGGVVQLPGLSAASASVAFDVNDAGNLVGYSEVTKGGPYRAVMWTRRPNGRYDIVDLGLGAGFTVAYAQAISEGKNGVPVRVAGFRLVNGVEHAALWQ